MGKPRDRFEDIGLYQTWDDDYYGSEFLRFYGLVLDYVFNTTGLREGDEILEAGCGPGVHTTALARRGLTCVSVDFSAAVLEEARTRVGKAALLDRVTFKQEDLTDLSFPDSSFSNIFCWGVIMHIPEPEKAIRELSRVLKPGGHLSISSNNANSFDKFLMEEIAYRLKRPKTLKEIGRSEMGRYAIFRENDQDLFVQALFTRKIISSFVSNGLKLEACIGTHVSELYTLFSSKTIRRAFAGLNNIWLRHVRIPNLCAGHLLTFSKPQDG